MNEGPKIVSRNPAKDVARPRHCFDQHSLAWEDRSPYSLRARRRVRDEHLHVGIAADHSIERDYIRRVYLRSERHKIALQKSHAIGMATSLGLICSSSDVRGRSIYMDRGISAPLEQLMMDDTDSTADVEEGRATHAGSRQLIEQQLRRFVGPLLAITSHVFRRVLLAELRLIAFARTTAQRFLLVGDRF